MFNQSDFARKTRTKRLEYHSGQYVHAQAGHAMRALNRFSILKNPLRQMDENTKRLILELAGHWLTAKNVSWAKQRGFIWPNLVNLLISRTNWGFRICWNIVVVHMFETFSPQCGFFGIYNVVEIVFFYAVLYWLNPTWPVFLATGWHSANKNIWN